MNTVVPREKWVETLAFTRLVAIESLKSFMANFSLQQAATLAYYGFISLMPLMLLMMIVMSKFFMSSDMALDALHDFITQIFPQFTTAIIDDVAALSNRRIWGALTILIIFLSITPFAGSIRAAFLRIFKADPPTHFLKATLRDMVAVLLLLVVMILLVVVRLICTTAQKHMMIQSGLLQSAISLLLPTLFTIGAIAFLYRVFSPVRPRRRAILAGALTATALLIIIRPLFTWILKSNPDYGFAFGSMKAIFLIMMWVYYCFIVLLFGAEVMANTDRREALFLRALFKRTFLSNPILLGPLLSRFLREAEPDAVLFHEGDHGESMYYILEGHIRLTYKESLLKTLGPNEYFGEMALLLKTPRTATAVVGDKGARLVVINPDNFDIILRENPKIVQTLLVEMARRLKDTNEVLTPPKSS